MTRDRQKRSASSRVFLITGVPQNERIMLGKHVQKLGAVYAKTEHFQSNATHVICGKLSRSEKFLGALALGRWIVRPQYVTASLQAGKWLDEVDYEWSTLNVQGHDQILAIAAKRNRWRASMNTEKVFSDWQVAVVMSDAQRQAVYKRLLIYGGAKVMELKLPMKNPDKYSDHLTYLFTDKVTAPLMQSLQERGVMCLCADYISDCIILDPSPDPLAYVLRTNDTNRITDTFSSYTVFDDSISANQFRHSRMDSSSTSTITRKPESFDDDKLVLSQCARPERHTAAADSSRSRNDNGMFKASDIVVGTSIKDGNECFKMAECHDANEAVDIFGGITNRYPGSDDDVIMLSAGWMTEDSIKHAADDGVEISNGLKTEDFLGRNNTGTSLPSQHSKTHQMKCPAKDSSTFKVQKTFSDHCKQRDPPNPPKKKLRENSKMDCCGSKDSKSQVVFSNSRKEGISVSSSGLGDRVRQIGQSFNTSNMRQRPTTPCMEARDKDKRQFWAACSAFQDSTRHLTLPSGLSCRQGQPCPVAVTTTVNSSSITVTSSQSSSTTTVITSSSKLPGRKKSSDCPISVADMTREMKAMKSGMTKGPVRQSLVSTTPAMLQTSLRQWFSPDGKENGEKSKHVADSTVKLEVKTAFRHKLPSKNVHVNEKQQIKDGTVHKAIQKVQKNVSNSLLGSQKTSQGHRSNSANLVSKIKSKHSKCETTVPCSSNDLSVLEHVSDLNPVISETQNSSKSSCLSPKGRMEVILPNSSQCVSHRNPSSLSGLNRTAKASMSKLFEDSETAAQSKDGCTDDSKTNNVPAGSGSLKSVKVVCEVLLDNMSASLDTNATSHILSHKKGSVQIVRSARLDHGHTNSSDDVLSARSLNKTRCRRRVKTKTTCMKSYADVLRKRRKAAASETEQSPKQPSPLSSPKVRKTETPPKKRRKTVRGLGIKTSLMSESLPDGQPYNSRTESEGPPVTQSLGDSVPKAFFPQGDIVIETKTANGKQQKLVESSAVSSAHAVTTLPKTKQNSQSLEMLNHKELAAEVQNSTPKISCARWQLSHVPHPNQFDLTNCSTSNLVKLSSKTLIPDSLRHMISSCVDENYFQSAVAFATTEAKSCPSVDLFRHMILAVRKAENRSLVNQANAVIMSWLDQFPPVTSALRTIYEEALGISDWESFRKILENAVTEAEAKPEGTCPASQANCGARMVLRIAQAALEKNFLHFCHCVSRQGRNNCLIIRCLWTPSYQVYPNGRTRDLLQFLERALKHRSSSRSCWQELLSLVSMATQCCYLADNGWQWTADGQVERCCSPMVQELTQTITGGGVDSSVQLQQVLSRLSPPWLLRQIVATLLADYDDYLISGGFTTDPITLKTIVTKYFFLLPKLSALDKSENPSPRKKLKRDHDVKDENKAPSVDPKLTAEKINKKNPKGETMLHKAAIKNNISLMKQILAVPGVDVNCQDYAGWTPLHEACNHGNVECARALLKFVPSATLDTFFCSGKNQGRVKKVDLHLANEEGITALHDAVLMNQISIVKLLLKYGGSSLLKAKTVVGSTAWDLARTEEMRQLLSRDTVDLSFSQDSSSQDLDSQERDFVPSSFMYKEVLDSSTQVSASLEDVRRFLALLTMLLRSHLQVQQQQQQLQKRSQQQQGQLLLQQQLPQTEKCQEDMKFCMQNLRRHVKNITTEDVFASVSVQLCVLETLLTECCC